MGRRLTQIIRIYKNHPVKYASTLNDSCATKAPSLPLPNVISTELRDKLGTGSVSGEI